MVKTVNGVDYAFRWCPPGSFMMGSPEGEGLRMEIPQHRVTLTKGFWMLETKVTQEMWESVMGDNPSNFKGLNLPVETVSWDDCQEFCEKLSQQSGFKIQLPTEAQWEYACRAGTTGEYSGTGNLDEMGWYYGNSDTKTHPVGEKKPNAWGLFDMHGNVWEWCQDRYEVYSDSAVTDPTGPDSGSNRVVRGGSWYSFAEDCRSANRFYDTPTYRGNRLGLRLVFVP
ncbi:MAG: formylglycine-generating enzyme family protein [Planctomycetia bacterium]|nr:formylglycine-generating enzyme family protein [Planctomycetia bacterium]